MPEKITYHGWIVVTRRDGYADTFHVEFTDKSGERVRLSVESAAQAVEFWDARTEKKVKLLPLPIGAFRVYTGDEGEHN